MSSSILYAYFRTHNPPKNVFTTTYIPILNIPAKDVDLRPEFKAVLQMADIAPADLLTLDDLPSTTDMPSKLPVNRTRWIIVDHNKLEGEIGAIYSDAVHGVIDHHVEEHAVPKETAPEPRMIESCGSCTSLVLHFFEEDWTSLPPSASDDAFLAKLALGSILVDTKNLEDESKATHRDRSARDLCVEKIKQVDTEWNQKTFYEDVDKAKKDIESLPLQGILRKDYKEWTEAGMKLGMSSVVKPLQFLASKAQDEENPRHGYESVSWDSELNGFMGSRELDLHAVMTAFVQRDTFVRELALQWKDVRANAAGERFNDVAREQLGLEPQSINGIAETNRKVWRQHAVEKSRKQVAPLIRAAMKEESDV
jgi:exopolyphosphatase